MRRTLAQMAGIGILAVFLAFTSNGLRSGPLPWRGSDPETLRHPDLVWIDPTEAAARQDDVNTLFLDARSPEAFARRHARGAVSFPADAIEHAWAELRDFLTPDMTLVVYADDANLAARVHDFLKARGFDARVLAGGWEAWERARLPVESGGAP